MCIQSIAHWFHRETGPFGPIFRQYIGKPEEAIARLIKEQNGEAPGALYHPEVGLIDLVWGREGTGNSDGYGLSKLVKHHPDVVLRLQEILLDMDVVKKSENRIHQESLRFEAVVRLSWDNRNKTWLLTAFEKKNSALDNSTDTDETLSGEWNDTATPQDTVFESKGSQIW